MKKIIILIVLLGLLAVFLYFQENILDLTLSLFERAEKTTEETIAKINQRKKNVRLKRANSTIWNSAEESDRLAKQDSLSTGYDSNAVVQFDMGYFLKLGENSYIVIDKPQNDIDISMDKGFLQAKNETKDDSTLRIKTRSSITEVKGKTEFGVRVNKDDSSEVWVNKGKAKVISNSGEVTEVNKNEQKQFLKKESPAYIFKDFYFNKKDEKQVYDFKDSKNDKENKVLNSLVIQQNISKNKKKINSCYLKAKYKYENAAASFALTISNTGVVKDVRLVSSKINDTGVQNCAMFWLRSIKFPAYEGEDTNYTVNLEFQ